MLYCCDEGGSLGKALVTSQFLFWKIKNFMSNKFRRVNSITVHSFLQTSPALNTLYKIALANHFMSKLVHTAISN